MLNIIFDSIQKSATLRLITKSIFIKHRTTFCKFMSFFIDKQFFTAT